MSFDIQHDTSASRFETVVDGARCDLDYRLRGDVMTITHTGVPASVGGRGIAAALVLAAFTTAQREQWKVVPACSYAAVWVQRHPEFAALCV